METMGKAICLMVLLFCAAASPGHAEMYSYVDGQGKRCYTNAPTSGNSQIHESQEVVISKPSSQPWPEARLLGRREFWPKGSSEAYNSHISLCSNRYNVDPYLIKAIIRAESDFDSNALSGKGAQGLMQLMPGTARDLHVANPFDPRANIDGGTRYFRTMLDTFNGNIPLSLTAYNAGPNLVKQTNRIPEIPETVEYVQRVLHHYKAYKGVNGTGR
jgi:soluble lytic murein transglycosylase-like protein